ncbi:GAF domain-containing protein [Marinitoga sp. 38H-ov]|uniref:GAF domain-containing protein n=1 Tax=Marinitoga sp. 38H-ov TaxID=1755814 RepID=UPI0016945BC1|nr:GAF domain-containing protein [Marinitoga sp. 38H-ov]KAF2956138.1 hypothetical protein AS160_07150 [Marinitoga sp. 38H-ov]
MDKIKEKSFIVFSNIFKYLSNFEYNDFYDMNIIFTYILEYIINSNKNLSTGSIILRDDDGYFRYIATKGHDFNILKNIVYNKYDFSIERFYGIHLLKSGKDFEKDEHVDLLIKGGNLLTLKSYLSIPILSKNEVIGFLNLDNYSNENIFSDEIIQLSKYFSNYMGYIYELLNLKRELSLNKIILEKANISNNLFYNKPFLIDKVKLFFENYSEFNFAIIKLKNNYENNVLDAIFKRINKLFIDDYVAYDNNHFYILSEYISKYFFDIELKKYLEKRIYFEKEIIPEYDYYLYDIPEDIKTFNDLILLII